MEGYNLFVSEVKGVQKIFPSLHSQKDADGKYFLRGEIEITDLVNGKVWETYHIEVHHSNCYPNCFPKVYETSNKIPRIADWHVNADGSCCIKVLPEELLLCANGIGLSRFITDQIFPYFYNQTFRKTEGYYVNGERPHGEEGIAQFYREELKSISLDQTISFLEFITFHQKPSRTSMCFCGKRTKFRKCHRSVFDRLSILGSETLKRHLELLNNLRANQSDLL